MPCGWWPSASSSSVNAWRCCAAADRCRDSASRARQSRGCAAISRSQSSTNRAGVAEPLIGALEAIEGQVRAIRLRSRELLPLADGRGQVALPLEHVAQVQVGRRGERIGVERAMEGRGGAGGVAGGHGPAHLVVQEPENPAVGDAVAGRRGRGCARARARRRPTDAAPRAASAGSPARSGSAGRAAARPERRRRRGPRSHRGGSRGPGTAARRRARSA